MDARAALDALASSGLSLSAFANREGLDPQRLRLWRHKLRAARPAQPTFIEVRERVSERVEIVLPRGLLVRVSESVDPVALRRLVDALECASC